MQINTKYSIGDERWFIDKDTLKATHCRISGIKAYVTTDPYLSTTVIDTHYQLAGCYHTADYIDTKTFATKDDLLNSL